MESTRQQKFARSIQKDLGDIFQRDGRDFFGNAFVTVTEVRITPDLSLARVNVSILQKSLRTNAMEMLRRAKPEIRKRLGMKLKDTIHHIPDLEFFLDESLDHVEKMDSIMKNINIPDQTKTNPEDYSEEID